MNMKYHTLRPILLSVVICGLLTPLGWSQSTPAPEPTPAANLPDTPFDAPPGTWTLVILPDTQKYAQMFPDVFLRQTEWIAANKDKHRILFVAHEGDITQDDLPAEWAVAKKSMDKLSGSGIPYALALGNHDIKAQRGNCIDRSTLLNEYFKESDYRNSEAVGYFEPGRLDNTWHTFTSPQGKFLVVSLEFGPRDEVLQWAGKVISDHPDDRVIILTHAYLFQDNTRYDWAKHGLGQHANPKGTNLEKSGTTVNDGEEMWHKLVSKHKNIEMVLCGHVLIDGNGYAVSEGESGNKVHQILANYQTGVKPDRGYGGGGFLRLMQFLPDGTVRVKTYSPWYDSWLTDSDQQFTFKAGPGK